MSKVTSKLQVTIPKALAEQCGIRPGDEIDWLAAGEGLRVMPTRASAPVSDSTFRLRLFDEATRRQLKRQAGHANPKPEGRGWKREELYERGKSR